MWRIAADAPTFHLWSLSEDVLLHRGSNQEQLVLTSRWGVDRLDRPHPAVYEALRRMDLGPVLLANAADTRPGPDSPPAGEVQPVVRAALRGLSHLVVRTLGVDDLRGPLLSVVPTAPQASFSLVRLPARQAVRVPGHVTLTVLDSGLVVENAQSPYRVVLHRPEAALVVALLAWPATPDAASPALRLPPRVTADIIDYLAAAGMATRANG
ncbi:NADH oxidase [Embleya sp. NBC_00896]|uniref:NADH oxidase n=1 Tax=Embleya sp. NBC_00896 TaxID=2975961 RepID=UPI002F9127AD|nr:NADH oxidase [Embleya sp. NBC_00896]